MHTLESLKLIKILKEGVGGGGGVVRGTGRIKFFPMSQSLVGRSFVISVFYFNSYATIQIARSLYTSLVG